MALASNRVREDTALGIGGEMVEGMAPILI